MITFTWNTREKKFKESGNMLSLLSNEEKGKINTKMRELSIRSAAVTSSLKSECLKCLICGGVSLSIFMIAPAFVYFGTLVGLSMISILTFLILCTFCTRHPILIEQDYKLVGYKFNRYYINHSYETNKFFSEFGYEMVVNHALGRVQLMKINESYGQSAPQTFNTNFSSLMLNLAAGANNNNNNGGDDVQVMANGVNNDSFESVETDISAEEKNYFKNIDKC